MAAPVYAFPGDVESATEDTPRLLASASRLVRRATRSDRYAVDVQTGTPLDDEVRDAFRAATLAQLAAWTSLGVDPAAGAAGVDGAIVATGVGSGSVTYEGAAAADDARRRLSEGLVLDALLILHDAGLASGQPGTL